MSFEWDPTKDKTNFLKHKLRLSEFAGFDDDPLVVTDSRRKYGESRYRAFGRIEGLGYMIAFTLRGEIVRLISFRRCHDKEMARHDRT